MSLYFLFCTHAVVCCTVGKKREGCILLDIRLATEEDVPFMYDVMLNSLGTYDASYCMPNSIEFFKSMVKERGVTLVAVVEGAVVGYAVLDLQLRGEQSNLRKLGLDGTARSYVVNFEVCMVLEKYRGQGIQKLFLSRTFDYAKSGGYRHIYTTAHPDNTASVRNLQAFGFRFMLASVNSRNEPRSLFYTSVN